MGSNSSNKNDDKIIFDNSPIFHLYQSGRIKRFTDFPPIPPSLDPKTKVESKDITIKSSETTRHDILVRLFKPKFPKNKRIPLLLYFHGGGFIVDSTFSPRYHNYLNNLAFEAHVVIVSVEYRRIPEHRLPAAYNDCWDALKWAVCHTREEWIREHVDSSRVYMMGDSAGGNIAHRLAIRVGTEGGLDATLIISGIILVHPYFWGKQRIGNEAAKCRTMLIPDLADRIWALACPSSSGTDDAWINPANDQQLSRLGCKQVLVFVAEKDFMSERGVYYKEALEKSGWQGRVEVVEAKGEDHVFHLRDSSSVNSVHLMAKVVAFLNPGRSAL